jgi:hypothetical protein
MSDQADDSNKPRAAQAEVMAKLREKLTAAKSGGGAKVISKGKRFNAERDAAHRSASASTPQMRK